MANVNFLYSNGDVLRDKVTGFTGVVMVCAAYATGCHHYGIQPQELTNGKPMDWEWIDQSRLELVSEGVIDFRVGDKRTSGPSPKGPCL